MPFGNRSGRRSNFRRRTRKTNGRRGSSRRRRTISRRRRGGVGRIRIGYRM